MIRYDTEATYALIFVLQGSIFRKALKHGGIAMCITGIFAVWKHYEPDEWDEDTFQNEFGYAMFTFMLGFIVIFRCNLAYNRFWEGRNSIEKMTNCWIDASIKCITFDEFENENPPENVRLWRIKMLGMFSLMHGTALCCLSDRELSVEIWEGVNPNVADQLNLKCVLDPTYLVYTWIQDELVERMTTGGLQCPAPIRTRIWQDLTNGMQGFNDADMVLDTPFPFPYAQILSLLLLFLVCTCGTIMLVFVDNIPMVIVLVGCVIGTFHGLNEVAKELEQPFGKDLNDLPMTEYQLNFNNRMQQLLYLGEDYMAIPPASVHAERHAQRFTIVQEREKRARDDACQDAMLRCGTPRSSSGNGSPDIAYRTCWGASMLAPGGVNVYPPQASDEGEFGVRIGRPTYDDQPKRDKDKLLRTRWQPMLGTQDPYEGILTRIDWDKRGEVH